MEDLVIEVPENVNIWGALPLQDKKKIALFAYLQARSITDWINEAIGSSIKCDEANSNYSRKDACQD